MGARSVFFFLENGSRRSPEAFYLSSLPAAEEEKEKRPVFYDTSFSKGRIEKKNQERKTLGNRKLKKPIGIGKNLVKT